MSDQCQCYVKSTKQQCKNRAQENGLCWSHIKYGCKSRVGNVPPTPTIPEDTDCDNLGGMVNYNNSCYYDTAIYALLYPNNSYIKQNILNKDLSTLLLPMKGTLIPLTSMPEVYSVTVMIQDELKKLKKAIQQHLVVNCNLMRQYMVDYRNAYLSYLYPDKKKADYPKDINWIRTQNEPLDVIARLRQIFNLPDTTVTVFEKYFITDQQVKTGLVYLYPEQRISQEQRLTSFTVMISSSALLDPDFDLIDNVLDQKDYIISEEKNGSIALATRIIDTPLLHIHIDRIHTDQTGSTTKQLTPINIPLTLPLPSKPLHLNSIIVHLGTVHGGHYVAFISCKGTWYRYNDIAFNRLEKVGTYEELLAHQKYGVEVKKNSTDLFFL